jgi:hypothetical protein
MWALILICREDIINAGNGNGEWGMGKVAQTISTIRMECFYILYMQTHWEVTASMLTYIPGNKNNLFV